VIIFLADSPLWGDAARLAASVAPTTSSTTASTPATPATTSTTSPTPAIFATLFASSAVSTRPAISAVAAANKRKAAEAQARGPAKRSCVGGGSCQPISSKSFMAMAIHQVSFMAVKAVAKRIEEGERIFGIQIWPNSTPLGPEAHEPMGHLHADIVRQVCRHFETSPGDYEVHPKPDFAAASYQPNEAIFLNKPTLPRPTSTWSAFARVAAGPSRAIPREL